MQKTAENFRRRILLIACGLAPQVVTETLYALARQQRSMFPNELWIITTAAGARRVRQLLIEQCWLQRLLSDYRLPKISFCSEHILVIQDSAGRPLDDIQTTEDNTQVANIMQRTLLGMTNDPDSAVHVSLAGGRKTMGFYAGYALSLYGRSQDRLSHVLVSSPFEMHPDFFYPPPEPQRISNPRDPQSTLCTADAEVQLADIPFVRLSSQTENLRKGEQTYSEAVEIVRRQLEPTPVEFSLRQQTIQIGEQKIPLSPSLFVWYSWFLTLRQQKIHIRWTDAGLEKKYLHHFAQVYGEHSSEYERVAIALSLGMEKDYFLEKNSRVNARLKKVLEGAASAFLIQKSGKRPNSRYSLSTPIHLIKNLDKAKSDDQGHPD